MVQQQFSILVLITKTFLFCIRAKNIEETMTKPISEKDKEAVAEAFERGCKEMLHHFCNTCKRVALDLHVDAATGLCKQCCSLGVDYYLKNNLLPLWFKDGKPQFYVPEELECLTVAEKMLIQQVSPFIPLQHIKHGIFGLSGHVCSFEQDIDGLVMTLPRKREDSKVIHVMKTIKAEIGGDESAIQTFKVRKDKVWRALCWLKQYNIHYKQITIDMTSLDWIDGTEGNLDVAIEWNDMETEEDDILDCNADLGPLPKQTKKKMQTNSDIPVFGCLNEDPSDQLHLSEEDAVIQDALREAVAKSPNKSQISIEWPTIAEKPISEYSDTPIFALAYPWLFPGGFGDPTNLEAKDLKDWGDRMYRYFDGRFQKDKFFLFFAMNYIVRHRNASSAQWFIKGFNNNGPATLEELQEKIASGDNSFINRITYYNMHVKGSTPFWQQKRQELYSWVNYHVQEGHGPPQFFITLSCAESYWPDIFRLIKQRMELANEPIEKINECYYGSPKATSILNEHSLVVQEYFQKRVKLWLDTVGTATFGIKHYWVRYEFAPGRGQIHAHMLCISKDNSIYDLAWNSIKNRSTEKERAQLFAKWLEDKIGLTACLNSNANPDDSRPHPSSVYFTESNKQYDTDDLLRELQIHKCSGFCMKAVKGQKQ